MPAWRRTGIGLSSGPGRQSAAHWPGSISCGDSQENVLSVEPVAEDGVESGETIQMVRGSETVQCLLYGATKAGRHELRRGCRGLIWDALQSLGHAESSARVQLRGRWNAYLVALWRWSEMAWPCSFALAGRRWP